MTWSGLLSQLLEITSALLLAPLLLGWVNQCRAWLQNKSAPSVLQPYRMLHKLFNKESVVADQASPIFRVVASCSIVADGFRTSMYGNVWAPHLSPMSIESHCE